MGQGDLVGLGPGAAAHQTSMRDGMVGCPERAVLEEGCLGGKLVLDGVDPGHIQGFVNRHAGHDARQ